MRFLHAQLVRTFSAYSKSSCELAPSRRSYPALSFAESVPDQLSTCDEAPQTCRTWRRYYTENTALISELFWYQDCL
jgi:hypothetical protein